MCAKVEWKEGDKPVRKTINRLSTSPYLCFPQKNLLVCDYCLLLNVVGVVSLDYLEEKESRKRRGIRIS